MTRCHASSYPIPGFIVITSQYCLFICMNESGAPVPQPAERIESRTVLKTARTVIKRIMHPLIVNESTRINILFLVKNGIIFFVLWGRDIYKKSNCGCT